MLPRNILGKLQNFPSQLHMSNILPIWLFLLRYFLRLSLLIHVISGVDTSNSFMLDKVDVKRILNLQINLPHLVFHQLHWVFNLAVVRLVIFFEVEAFEGIVQHNGLNLAHLKESLPIQKERFSTLHSPTSSF